MCWSDLTFEDLTSFNGRTGGWGRIFPTVETAEESATPCLRGSFLSQRLVVGRSDVDLQPSGRHSGLSPLSHYEVSLGLKRGLCIPTLHFKPTKRKREEKTYSDREREKRQVLDILSHSSNSACRWFRILVACLLKRQQQQSAAPWATKQHLLRIVPLAPHGDMPRKGGSNPTCLTPYLVG